MRFPRMRNLRRRFTVALTFRKLSYIIQKLRAKSIHSLFFAVKKGLWLRKKEEGCELKTQREGKHMAEGKKYLTEEGLAELQEELNHLIGVRRHEIAEEIKVAREQGDLSENAEYDAARDEQRDIEARIAEIEALLKNVEVIDKDDIKPDEINIGSKVTVFDCDYDEEIVFSIVGSTQASSLKGKISNESQVGSALLHKHVGEEVVIETPAGNVTYRILNIERA